MPIYDVLSGVHLGSSLGQIYRIESQQLQGNDRGLATTFQLGTIYLALEQISNCYKALNWKPISSSAYYFTCLSPITLTLLTHFDLKSNFINKSVVHLSNHLGTIGRISAGVATLALFYLKGQTIAIVSIVSYAADWYANSDYCNEKVKKILTTTLFALSNVYGLSSKRRLLQLVSLIDLICLVQKFAWPYLATTTFGQKCEKFAKPYFANLIAPKISLIDSSTIKMENMFAIPFDSLEIDTTHFTRETLLVSGQNEPSYAEMCATLDKTFLLFDSINWDKHVDVLLKKLNGSGAIRGDRHWRDPTKTPETSDIDQKKKAIAFLREGFAIAILRLKNSSAKNRGIKVEETQVALQIRTGRHQEDLGTVNKDTFTTMERFCTAMLSKLESSDEVTKADAIIRWGIEIGDYCGPAYLDILPEIYRAVAKTELNFDAEQKILLLLSEKRSAFIPALITTFMSTLPDWLVELSGLNSFHYRNQVASLYGKTLGINLYSAENDHSSSYSDGNRVVLAPIISSVIMPAFYTQYNKNIILDSIIEEVKSGRVEKQKIQGWFEKYLVEKEGLVKDSQPFRNAIESIYDFSYLNETDFHSEALIFMLIKMGVLGIKKTAI